MAIFSTDQLIESYTKAIKLAKEFLTVSEKTNEQIKETAKGVATFSEALDTKTADGLKAFNTELTKTNKLVKLKIDNDKEAKKAQEDLLKAENEFVKLNKKLSQGLSEQAVEAEKLKVQIQEQNKERKKLAKDSLGLFDAYTKESNKLRELKNQYKNLAVQNKENTKEGKELLKNITKLDKKLVDLDKSVNDNFRTIGKYENAVKGLNSTIGKLGIAAVIVKGVELLSGAFGDSRNGALLMEQALNNLTATVSVTVGRFTDTAVKIKKIFDGASGLTGTVVAFGDAVSQVFKVFDDQVNSDGSVTTYAEQIEQAKKSLDSVTAITQKYNIEIQALERSISTLNKTQVLQLQLAENDTLSFQIREAASKQAVKSAIELGKIQEEKAKKQLDQQRETIATQLQAKGVAIDVESVTSQQIMTLLKLQDAEGEYFNAKKISSEQEQAFTDAFVANQDIQLESSERLADTLEKQNKLYNDYAQAVLDIQIDGLDNQKSINERLIASDKETFENREKLLKKNRKDFEEGFKAQAETLVTLNDRIIISERKRIKNNTALTKSQKDLQLAELDRQQAVLTTGTIEELVNIKNNEILKERIIDLELNEKSIIDLLTVIRDYRTGIQDLNESEEGYNDTLEDRKSLNNEIALQQRKLNGEQIDLDEERRKDRIKQLKEQIAAIEGETKQKLELQKELNVLLLEEQAIKEATELKAQEELEEKKRELTQKSIQFASDQFNAFQDKKMDALDRELEQGLRNQDIIAQGIENGSKLGEQSLAQEKALQAEREAELKRLEAEALKLNALISLLQVWGDTGSLSETLAGFATIKNTANSVAGFYTGTDSVGSSGSEVKHSDGRDGYIAKLDKGEMVFNSGQSDELRGLGFTTRDSMLDLARMSEMGVNKGGQLVNVVSDNSKVVKELQEQNKLLKQLPKQMPITNRDLSDDPRYIEQVVKTGNIKTKVKTRARGTWNKG